jgi:putative FmdB family regulatory protein
MPLYEYYCQKCATKYELLRPMGRSDEPGECPQGHRGGARTISVFAPVAKNAAAGAAVASGGGCGCGGGGCGCAN